MVTSHICCHAWCSPCCDGAILPCMQWQARVALLVPDPICIIIAIVIAMHRAIAAYDNGSTISQSSTQYEGLAAIDMAAHKRTRSWTHTHWHQHNRWRWQPCCQHGGYCRTTNTKYISTRLRDGNNSNKIKHGGYCMTTKTSAYDNGSTIS